MFDKGGIYIHTYRIRIGLHAAARPEKGGRKQAMMHNTKTPASVDVKMQGDSI